MSKIIMKKFLEKILLVSSVLFLVFSCCRTEVGTPQNSIVANIPYEPGPINKSSIPLPEASTDFVQGSEDIPLLNGLEKMFDESLGFDSPSGSIMSSSYESNMPLENIKKFYGKTLPQMGWNLKKIEPSKLSFEREKENLEIELIKQNEKNIVKFFISSSL
jgi:hypothetical protein